MPEETAVSPEELILEQLVDRGLLSSEDIAHATSLERPKDQSILAVLNQIGVLSDETLTEAYRHATGLEVTTEHKLFAANLDDIASINPAFLKRLGALLLSRSGPLAVIDPFDTRALGGVEFAIGCRPKIVIAKAGDWSRAFTTLYEGQEDLSGIRSNDVDEFSVELADQARDAPIVRRVAAWLSEAADAGASDIHFDAKRSAFEVRYRIDGLLQTVAREPKSAAASIIARIKVLAQLDLGERNKSQDGRATIVVRGRRLDVRVSIISTIDGESAVIRLLDRPAQLLSVSMLGFPDDVSSALKAVMAKKTGLFIVAGPTGSGKTTTLYSCLEQLKDTGLKILSVEDPVEYHFDHVNQVQISSREGRSFAGVLRSFLRHDPDVILVGEIRDSETAKIAVEAALQGHLVLATLHAIDVPRVRTRLLDMGVEAFQLDATLVGAMAQRLVRLLCPGCKEMRTPTDAERSLFEEASLTPPSYLYDAKGCSACRGEGYSKREAVAEINLGLGHTKLAKSLLMQGLQMAAQGRTSLQEIAGLDVQ